MINLRCLDGAQSSPRPWRCFPCCAMLTQWDTVFSTSVEVFLKANSMVMRPTWSSPRPWRCFLRRVLRGRRPPVFSTSVEVFPSGRQTKGRNSSLLHVRGGVSEQGSPFHANPASSPRPWRCFSASQGCTGHPDVFSTSVEVFLIDLNSKA